MKINRTIERRIEVTAREVYDALAVKFDLASNPTTAKFDYIDGCDTLILLATETVEQELAA